MSDPVGADQPPIAFVDSSAIVAMVNRSDPTHDQAIALLREQTGEAFDHRCVTALERVLRREHDKQLAVAV